MEHLKKEPLNRGDRVKLPGSPRVSDRSAQRHDRGRIEGLADIVLDLHHRLLDTGRHRRTLVRECWLQQLHSRPEVFLSARSRLARPPACNDSIDVLACDAVATKGLAAIFVPFVAVTFLPPFCSSRTPAAKRSGEWLGLRYLRDELSGDEHPVHRAIASAVHQSREGRCGVAPALARDWTLAESAQARDRRRRTSKPAAAAATAAHTSRSSAGT